MSFVTAVLQIPLGEGKDMGTLALITVSLGDERHALRSKVRLI